MEVLFVEKDLLLICRDGQWRLAAREDAESIGLTVSDEDGFGFSIADGGADELKDASACLSAAGKGLPDGFYRCELRKSNSLLQEEDWKKAARQTELRNWSRRTRYCGICGGEMRKYSAISKKCLSCGTEQFPSPAPAVLVLVKRGNKALLVHANNFRSNMFALVAGFVESGETLEECVRREVMEETSLEIDNLKYFGSQSWPFPFQLMVAFTADWKSGEIAFADKELTAGGWFERNATPELPTPPSLSRRLIDAWLEGNV